MKLRIMLVDDNTPFREAMRIFLELQDNIELVIEVTDGNALLDMFSKDTADVVCMDVGLHGLNGVDLTRQLLAFSPAARVVGLSGHTDLKRVAQMVEAGALGYVVKGSDSGELLKAIYAASQNQSYFDSTLAINTISALKRYLIPE